MGSVAPYLTPVQEFRSGESKRLAGLRKICTLRAEMDWELTKKDIGAARDLLRQAEDAALDYAKDRILPCLKPPVAKAALKAFVKIYRAKRKEKSDG